MSYLLNKELLFKNAALLLNLGETLVIADWFKASELTEQQMNDDIKLIKGKFPELTRFISD